MGSLLKGFELYDNQRQAHLPTELQEVEGSIVLVYDITEEFVGQNVFIRRVGILKDNHEELAEVDKVDYSQTMINWGDGTTTQFSSSGSSYHTYSKAGTYIATIKGVNAIGDHAFSEGDYHYLKKIIIPKSIINIREIAFGNCTLLQSITMPDSVVGVGVGVFSGCTNLESVKISSNLTEISTQMFKNCTSLQSVVFGENSKISKIGSSAFNGCTALKNIDLPRTIETFGNYAFANCDLENIRFNSIMTPTLETSIGTNKIQKIEVPIESLEDYKTATNLVNYASKMVAVVDTKYLEQRIPCAPDEFSNNLFCVFDITTENTAITFSNTYASEINWGDGTIDKDINVGNIGNYKHTYQSVGKYIATFKGVTAIGGSAFLRCRPLIEIKIPKTVTSISANAFNTTSITTVTIPNSVALIAQDGFRWADKLKKVVFETGRTKIGLQAFFKCENLKEIEIQDATTIITLTSTFGNTFDSSVEKIIVPIDVLDTYKSQTNWSAVASKILSMVDSRSTTNLYETTVALNSTSMLYKEKGVTHVEFVIADSTPMFIDNGFLAYKTQLIGGFKVFYSDDTAEYTNGLKYKSAGSNIKHIKEICGIELSQGDISSIGSPELICLKNNG